MKITKLYFNNTTEEQKKELGVRCLSLVDIVFDRDIIVKNVKLMSGDKGEYLVFPTNKIGKSITFPITEDFRQYILNEVLNQYKESE